MMDALVEYLDKMGEQSVAVCLLDALGRHSHQFEQFDEIAKSYFKIKQHDKALVFAEKALTCAPVNSYAAKYNVINVANHANHPERALTLIKQLELINPQDTDVQLEKAFSLFLMNMKSDAEAVLRRELENPLNDTQVKTKIRFNLGTYELLRDEFQSGLRKFLFEGRKLNYWHKPHFPFDQWQGHVEPHRIIYVRAEAGIGDEFINVRWCDHLKARGMQPIWYSERTELCEIFRRCGFRTASDPRDILITQNPCWVHSMDLPVLLNLTYDDLWKGTYLFANPDLQLPHHLFSHTSGPRIGIRWQGNPSYDQDLHRSIPFGQLFRTVQEAVPNAHIYSLQRDTGLEEITCGDEITLLHDHMHTYDHTLSLMDQLDLVITSCTSIAHAAAAMGKQTVVITPISAYYTWCHSDPQSPWYGDHVTLLRQQKPRTWQEPLTQLKEHLHEKFNNR
jgi:hypothetical protein